MKQLIKNKKIKKIFDIKNYKKSQTILFGSLLLLAGVIIVSYGHLKVLREDVFEQVRLSLMDISGNVIGTKKQKITDNVDINNLQADDPTNPSGRSYYNRYVGYLSIPKIGLKRGFLAKEDRYNDIQHNIMVSQDATYPDVENGNFILIAHSGDAYISFFAYLYKLKIGDVARVQYRDKEYKYQLVKIEEQPKVGEITIHRPNYNTKGLTLITCTKDNDTTQSIYIFEIM